jgi:colanic acid/amylovoran biosynthesis glycosyltransferase
MRLLYVTSMLPFGPMEAFFIPEIVELKRRGHDVLVVPMRPRGRVMHEDARAFLRDTLATGVLSPRVLAAGLLEGATRPLRTLACLWEIRRSRSVRVLLKNLVVFPKGLWLARVARRSRAEHIHAQWASASSTVAYVAASVARVPWSFTAHRWDIAENNLVEAKARTAAFVRAIDRDGGDELAMHMGRFRDALSIIHMGVPRSLMESTADDRRPPVERGVREPLRVVMAANFVEKKGHVYAIEAVRRLSERGTPVRVDFAGDGPLRAPIEARAAELKVSDLVRFMGVLSHERLIAGLRGRAWDVALLPSVVTSTGEKEGIPVFLIEALACGVPVVATATGGIPELLDGGGGLMVRQRDGGALAGALDHLASNPASRAALADAGRRHVRVHFTIEGAIDEVERRMLDARVVSEERARRGASA